MSEAGRRPFYSEYAWAFDLLIDRPVRKECSVMIDWLVERGVAPGAAILDAGCGTGRYSIELARRGYIVHGIDLSPELIDVARRSIDESHGSVSFVVGDIIVLPSAEYAGILCRGVLNDILDDEGRDAVFAAFVRALRPGGVLILDVREWGASVERKTREPLFRKRVDTDRGELTFTSVTAVDPDTRRLKISEQHALVRDGTERVSEYQFVMRCWEREEVRAVLMRHGFGNVRYFGAYDAAVDVGATDRLAVVAQRSRQPRGSSQMRSLRKARGQDSASASQTSGGAVAIATVLTATRPTAENGAALKSPSHSAASGVSRVSSHAETLATRVQGGKESRGEEGPRRCRCDHESTCVT